MKTIIRNYKSSDYGELAELLAKVYDSHVKQGELEDNYMTDSRQIFIAESDIGIIGCTFVELQEDYIRRARVLYITYVAVDEKYRKLGIGMKLLQAAYNLGKDLGCSALELTSADSRIEAHAFYEKIGFVRKKTTLFIKDIE